MFTLTVHSGDAVRIIRASGGENLLALLAENGICIQAPCRGNGTCGKCRVLYEANGTGREVSACRTAVTEDAVITVPRCTGGGLTQYAPAIPVQTGCGIGAAVDIGTTTVAAALFDLQSGTALSSRAVLNPQSAYGADVISRIAACGDGLLPHLTDRIRTAVAELIAGLCTECGTSLPDSAAVTGNTTMLHLFCGVDPTPIGTAPYTPVFTDMRTCPGDRIGIPAKEVTVLPSVSGYIGADTVCGILSLEDRKAGVSLLADLGTNGEMALLLGDRTVCAATAAGPALEGANIECGMGGVAGAVSSVSLQDGVLITETVENAPPAGLCGSGLVDLIARLLECGVLDESGCFDDECGHPLTRCLRDGRFYLTDTVYLSQKDVRQFQLAKAAIAAGILTLCESEGVDPAAIETLYIAGGLGFYLREDSALRTGLIPRKFAGRICAVGNTGLAGAAACLAGDARRRAESIAGAVQICELNGSAAFAERFVDEMSFA